MSKINDPQLRKATEKESIEQHLSQLFKANVYLTSIILLLIAIISLGISFYLQYQSFWGGIFYSAGITIILAIIINIMYQLVIQRKNDYEIISSINSSFDNKLTEVEGFSNDKFNQVKMSFDERLNKVETHFDDKFTDFYWKIQNSVVLNPDEEEKINDLIVNALNCEIDDKKRASDVYEKTIKSMITSLKGEVRSDMHLDIELKQKEEGEELEKYFYSVILYCSYKTVLSKKDKFSFCFTTDKDYYITTLDRFDYSYYSINLTNHITNDDFLSKEFKIYKVKNVFVDKTQLRETEPEKMVKNDEIIYIQTFSHSDLKGKEGKEVVVKYEIESILNRNRDCYFHYVDRPTKTITISLSSDLTNVNYLDIYPFFHEKKPNITTYDKTKGENRKVRADLVLDDWVFPLNGLVFIWHLDNFANLESNSVVETHSFLFNQKEWYERINLFIKDAKSTIDLTDHGDGSLTMSSLKAKSETINVLYSTIKKNPDIIVR